MAGPRQNSLPRTPSLPAQPFPPFSDPDLAGLELRSDRTEERRHGEVEPAGKLPEGLESAIVESDARLLLQILRSHTTSVTNDGGMKFSFSTSWSPASSSRTRRDFPTARQ